ncbi:XrtA system polysaccharide chain length determinant [Herbaspirillum robiniae]|uniref:Chain length-determining protein n=1 Tax=Herbaspirillum robiniae TaxID=2014887 RepID=A0A2D0B610_9BURK|nr:XrtA system polysaccharide chain length determinant [Herbaspirillum robiniae]NUU01795.1 chain length-determining protein [Herbaspirillum robiniae]OWY29824.1 chain length-determining protein [Herbaspirillum robiniae]
MADLISQLLSLLKGVWKHRWIAISIAWALLLIGSIVIFRLPNDFQASARVYVDTQSILKPLLSGMTTVPNIEQQVSIMSRTLLSRPNLERVTRMADLDIKAQTVSDKEKQVDELASRIKITQTGRDDIYTITYNNENPKLGKDVVQSLLTIFVEGSVGDKKEDSDKAVRFIGDQIKSYEEKLSNAENALKEFKQKNAELLPRQGSDYGSKLQESADALSQARLELAEAEQARSAIQKQLTGGAPSSGDDMPLMPTPEIDSRLQAANKHLDDLRTKYTEQHPDVVGTRRLIAELEKRKSDEAKNRKPGADPGANYSPMMQQLSVSLSDARAKAASMRARVDEYAARYARLKAQSIAAPDVEAQFTQLNRDYQINKDNYEKLVARRDAAKLSGDLSSATDLMTFRVIDPPIVPRLPAGPNRPRLLALLFVAALAAGIGVTFVMSQVRPSFITQHQLQQVTGLPVLGAVAMNWTDAEIARRKRGLRKFIAVVAAFFIVFIVTMAFLLLRA